jgi:hypothetical protein
MDEIRETIIAQPSSEEVPVVQPIVCYRSICTYSKGKG